MMMMMMTLMWLLLLMIMIKVVLFFLAYKTVTHLKSVVIVNAHVINHFVAGVQGKQFSHRIHHINSSLFFCIT